MAIRRFTQDSKTLLELTTTAISSAFNFLRIKSVPAGNSVEIEADGVDSDIDLNLKTKGTGQLLVNGSPINTGGDPGGTNTQIQYNNNGTFGGDTGFTTDGSGSVSIDGDLQVDNLSLDGSDISATGTGTLSNFTIDGGSF